MRLTDNEIRDITRLLEQGKPLPDSYRFLLFEDKREVELIWNGKTNEVCSVVLPFQTIEQVDVAVILNGLAAKNPERLNWKGSIVDLMKLVGMDSSLSARKQLATELHYSGDQSDTAAMNIWLHKEVLRKLSENGGKVPQELLS